LDFNQRETIGGLEWNFFGFGKKWNCDWFSVVYTNLGYSIVNFPNGGQSHFNSYGYADLLSRTKLSGDPVNGYTVTYPDGRQDIYGFVCDNGPVLMGAFLTEHRDAQGHSTRLIYYPFTFPVVRLRYVIDGDGRTNTVSYVTTNSYSTNLISQITDPFGRSAYFAYDNSGHLTNITDVAGISSSFAYSGDDVNALTTPYGTTRFALTDSSGSK